MRLKTFLIIENEPKEWNKHKKVALKVLSKKHKVDPKNLVYIGADDVIDEAGYVMFYYNVTDPKSPKYKSTVVYKKIIK